MTDLAESRSSSAASRDEALVLKTDKVCMRFGGLMAVSNLGLEIGPRQIVGLIGPNGAGKTTAFNVVTGMYKPTEGRVLFKGQDITGKRPHQITALGVARTFQNIRLFREASVLENVLVGCHLGMNAGLFEATLHLPSYRRKDLRERERAMELLSKVGLADHANDQATSLPYGKQRRLEIVRALATNPSLLLLDEPAAGMNPQESLELMEFIRRIQVEYQLSILLIEHHMQVVMGICEKLFVLDYGITIASGRPEEIKRNPKVIEAYLGVD